MSVVEKIPTGVPGIRRHQPWRHTEGAIQPHRGPERHGQDDPRPADRRPHRAARHPHAAHRGRGVGGRPHLHRRQPGPGPDAGPSQSGKLRVTDASRPMEGPMVLSGEYDISGLVHRVQAIVKQHGSQVVILDSATALFSPRPPQELLRSLFTQLIHAFRRMELTSVVLAEAAEDYGQLTTLGVEDFVCDMVVVLRNVVDGERRRRSLEINKYRGQRPLQGGVPLHHHHPRPDDLPPGCEGAARRAHRRALLERVARPGRHDLRRPFPRFDRDRARSDRKRQDDARRPIRPRGRRCAARRSSTTASRSPRGSSCATSRPSACPWTSWSAPATSTSSAGTRRRWGSRTCWSR